MDGLQEQGKHDPIWRWLWERLLLPLDETSDDGIVRARPQLRLVKNEDDSEE